MSAEREADAAIDAAELARLLDGELQGENVVVRRLAQPGDAGRGTAVVLFADEPATPSLPPATLLVADRESDLSRHAGAVVRVADPRQAFALLTALFDRRPLPEPGIDPAATVSGSAELDDGVRVAAGAVVAAGASIGRGSVVGEGAVIGVDVRMGRDCRIHPNATLLDGVRLGDRVIVHSGAIIGSDGFGYAPSPHGALKIRHLGTVIVAEDVEIGANTCIDRGTIGDTTIGAGTKIDNLCQIAHNVTIGRGCLIAGQSGIAGSTRIGDGVTLAGGVGIADHITIGDGATVGARSAVLKDVAAGERVLGYPALPYRRYARQSYLLGRLERMWRFVRERQGESR